MMEPTNGAINRLLITLTKFLNLIGYQQTLFEHYLDSLRVMPCVIGQYVSFARAVIKSISKLNSTVVLCFFTKKLNCWLFFSNFVRVVINW